MSEESSSSSSEPSSTDSEFENSDDLKSTDSEDAAEKLTGVVTMDKKHRMAANRQIRQVHKHSSNVKKIKVDQSLFQSNTLNMTEEEEREIREAKEKLEKLQKQCLCHPAPKLFEANQMISNQKDHLELRK